jgi:basic amino acid/polyamine antiporter, APA family
MKNSVKIGFSTAVSLVIANMIGTGVFTSLGFQVAGITDVFSLLMLWLIGGVISLCGALVYGEIGARYPDSGGEYNYLSRMYHPAIGFLSGWVSATVGFAAPIAMAAMALATYFTGVLPAFNAAAIAVGVVVVITGVHLLDLRLGSLFQRSMTILKVAVILFFIVAGFLNSNTQPLAIMPTNESTSVIFSGGFAIALFWVTYSYSGWNAASYITGQLSEPKRNLPKALLIGTLVVTLMYVLLNFVFLRSAPMSEITNKKEVGLISANYIFGEDGGKIMGLLISFLLVSAISAMIMIGPRVLQAMGKDVQGLRFFSSTNQNNIPVFSILSQSLLAIVLVLTARFEFVMQFTSFSLNLFTFLTVAGLFFQFNRGSIVFTTSTQKLIFLFLPGAVFLIFQSWILFYGLYLKPMESMLGLTNLMIGFLFWIIFQFKLKNSNE